MEELSLAVEVKEFVACGTFVEGRTTALEMFLRCEAKATAVSINEGHILDARFIPKWNVASERVYPLQISRDLATLLARPRSGGVYYGRFS